MTHNSDKPLYLNWKILLPGTIFCVLLMHYWSSGFKNGITWLGFVWALWTLHREHPRKPFAGLGPALLIYLAVTLLTVFRSVDTTFSFRQWIKLAEAMAGCVALAVLLRPRERAVAATICIALAMIVLWAWDLGSLLMDLQGQNNIDPDGRWYGSAFGFPTIAAGTLAPGIVMVGALWIFCKQRGIRLFLAAGLAICLVLLYFLQTRSVFLGLAGGLFIMILPSLAAHRKAVFIALLLLAVLMIALVASPERRAKWTHDQSSDRINIWCDATQLAVQQPVTGYGYGHGIFESVHEELGEERRASRVYNHTHNMIVEAVIQSGLLGLAAWLFLLGSIIHLAWKAHPSRQVPADRFALSALTGTITVLIIYGQFSLFFAQTPQMIFWALLGLLMAQCRTLQDEIPSGSKPPAK